MRRIAALASAAALTGGVLLLASPASAIECPPGTRLRTFIVAGRVVNVCVPEFHCDPVACDPFMWID